MVKRKRGELSVGFSWTNYAVITLLGLGMCALLLISGGAMWQWIGEQLYHSPYYAYPTSVPRQLGTIQNNENTTGSAYTGLNLPEGAQLVLATTSGGLYRNEANSQQFNRTPLHGEDVTVAPDGKTLAYIRNRKLYINQDGKERAVSVNGDVMMPAWGTSAKSLAFITREAIGDTVYRVTVESLQVERLITVPEIAAPPLTNPATGRLLIVEKRGVKDTVFYTIDPNCATQAACEQSRRDLATVKQSVNWADYHPNAASIVFSDMDDGNLYLLTTGSGDVQVLVEGYGYKRRPAFNSDGTNLIYTELTNGNKLCLLRLSDKGNWCGSFSNVASVDWVN